MIAGASKLTGLHTGVKSISCMRKIFICSDYYRERGEFTMRVSLIVLVMVFLMLPAIAEYTQVGGSFGITWLNQTGNLQQFSQPAGLWSWGVIPKGQMLSNGKLTEIGGGMLIYPAFPTSTTPIILNATTPGRELNQSNISQINPLTLEDPWTVAQTNDRPVLFRTTPY